MSSLKKLPVDVTSEGYNEKRPWCKIGKEFGNMEVEFDRIDRGALFLEKKCYTFRSGDKTKMVFKGVPKANLTVDRYEELFQNRTIVVTDITVFMRQLFNDHKPGIWIGKSQKIVRSHLPYNEWLFDGQFTIGYDVPDWMQNIQ